jgi:DNA-binding winged helix-turn-helix (wHTH) protein
MRIPFGPFVLDLGTRQLLRGTREVRVSGRAFQLMARLVAARPDAVSKHELQAHLWPETFVAEANLSNLIGELRAALGDDRKQPMYIRTLHGFGYAFCADVAVDGHPGGAGPEPYCWLEWGARRFPLAIGEHLIGRDPLAAVRIDATSVSRRHARVLVSPDGARLEDCESKNGTYLDRARVTAPIPLSDGAEIRIGSARVTVRMRSVCASTDTIDARA